MRSRLFARPFGTLNLPKLPASPPDAIFTAAAQATAAADPLNLTVGVLQHHGKMFTSSAVKSVNLTRTSDELTPGYAPISGMPSYLDLMWDLYFPDNTDCTHGALATAGGTNALYVAKNALELIAEANRSEIKFHLPSITWPNHHGVFSDHHTYSITDEHGRLAEHEILDYVKLLKPSDVFLWHQSCHNPTGAPYSLAFIQELMTTLTKTGATLLMDSAYWGLAGIELEHETTRLITKHGINTITAASLSKVMSQYGNRTGATLFHLPGRQSDLDNLLKYVATRTIRPVISNTPALGMKTAATVLGDKKLKALWLNDLDEVAEEMVETRTLVANQLAAMDYCDAKAIEAIRNGRGLFFLLPTPEGVTPKALVTHLNEQGVFPVLFPDGSIRCSLGGFSSATPEETEAKVARFTDALACCPTPGLKAPLSAG